MTMAWIRENIPYDAMGDYSVFKGENRKEESIWEPDRNENGPEES